MLPNLVCDIVVTGQKVGPVNMWGHVSTDMHDSEVIRLLYRASFLFFSYGESGDGQTVAT